MLVQALVKDRLRKGSALSSKSILHATWKMWQEYRQFAITHREATISKNIKIAVDEKARKRRVDKAKEECVICFSLQANITTICCDQVYHLHCLLKCIRGNKRCPTCRKELVFVEEAAPNVTQENQEDQVDSDEDDTSDDSTDDTTDDTVIEDADTTDDSTDDTIDVRQCAACLNMYTSASYSKNQYSKGPGSSRCRQCVATHNW